MISLSQSRYLFEDFKAGILLLNGVRICLAPLSNRMVKYERALKMYAPHLNLVADLRCKITLEGINLNRKK
jgi:hypothetical protein